MERKKITFDSFIRGIIIGAIIIGLLMLLNRLSSVLLPFFIAWLVAYMMYPLVTFFQYRLRMKSRILSIFCALITILVVGGGACYLLIPPMVEECSRVKDLLMEYFSNKRDVGNIPSTLSEFIRNNIDMQVMNQLFDGKKTSQMNIGKLRYFQPV